MSVLLYHGTATKQYLICTEDVVFIQSNSSYLPLRYWNAIRAVLCRWIKLIFLNGVNLAWLLIEIRVCEWQWSGTCSSSDGFQVSWSDQRWTQLRKTQSTCLSFLMHFPGHGSRLTWDQPLVSVRTGNQASAHFHQCRWENHTNSGLLTVFPAPLLNLWIKPLAVSNVMRKKDRAYKHKYRNIHSPCDHKVWCGVSRFFLIHLKSQKTSF